MATVLQYAAEEALTRHRAEASNTAPGGSASGLLARVSLPAVTLFRVSYRRRCNSGFQADVAGSSMRFDLTGLSATPTVIMSMPSSDHASLQTSFAQFAAAVAGGSTEAPGTSSSAGTSSAAACTSSAMAGPSSSARAAGSGFASKSGSSAPLSFSTKYVAWSPIEVDMISVPVHDEEPQLCGV